MSTASLTASADDAPSPVDGRTFLGHPVGLFILFFAEMWERFSYYGMRGLLKLYMVNYLFVTSRQVLQGSTAREPGNPDDVLGWGVMKHLVPEQPAEAASILYGLYTALVYLTPLFGGVVADRLLGQRKTVVVGGILMAIGHFVMAFQNLFFVALTFLIIGNGAFKPNVSTQVGGLYRPGDPRRDGAFSIFYMGINLGAFLCNLVCGTLAAVYGWHYGFAAAGVGMLLGLAVYLYGQRFLAPDNLMKSNSAAAEKTSAPVPTAPASAAAKGGSNVVYGAVVLGILGTVLYSQSQGWTVGSYILLIGCVTAAFFANRLIYVTPALHGPEWAATLALVGLCMLNVVFWAVYEQQGNTMQSWADEQTIWPVIAGFQIPSTWFQSVNAFCIILFAPLLNVVWGWQARRGTEPSSVTKMAIGCIVLGLSFIVMIAGAQVVGQGKGSPFWPVFCTVLLTVGELYLSPVGLSLVTKVSPARIVSMMMGMWFVSSFVGNYASGFIGVYYTRWSHETFFAVLTALGVGAGLAIWAFNKPLKRAIGPSV